MFSISKKDELQKAILLQCLEALQTPIALSLHMQLESGGAVSVPSISPANYISPWAYYKDSQAIALFSKNESVVPSSNLEKQAIKDFYEIERQNKERNLNYSAIAIEKSELLHKVRRNVKILLTNDVPSSMFEGSMPIFGPGSTSSCSGQETTYLHKVQAKPECTAQCIDYIEYVTRGSIARHPDDYVEVKGNVFFTVPKNFKTRRHCCVEPHLNTWYQRAIGLAMKRRLKEANYMLEHIPEINAANLKFSAKEYATLDLKQASDTIYKRIVEDVFPSTWFHHMNRARSHYTSVDGDWHHNEKFSSMGNGFTFEMETILFLSIVRAVIPQKLWSKCTVFGDDIMCPVDYAEGVATALEELQFIINREKSFADGDFKESCGVDVWLYKGVNVNVRPVYLRNLEIESLKKRYALANFIHRISLRCYGMVPQRSPFKYAYKAALGLIKAQDRFYGPDPYAYEDTFSSIDLVTLRDYELVYGDEGVWCIPGGERFVKVRRESDNWIYSYDKNDRIRLLELPKRKVKYQNFDTRTQLIYALTGGDPEGATSRNTPTITTTSKY